MLLGAVVSVGLVIGAALPPPLLSLQNPLFVGGVAGGVVRSWPLLLRPRVCAGVALGAGELSQLPRRLLLRRDSDGGPPALVGAAGRAAGAVVLVLDVGRVPAGVVVAAGRAAAAEVA